MKKIFAISIMLLLVPVFMLAESKDDRAQMRHELRLGWGDQLFESLVWHDPLSVTTTMPEDYQSVYNEDYEFSQHWWLEYQYRFNHWFGLGAMLDGSGATWHQVTRNGRGEEVSRDTHLHTFYNLVAMPTVRFTYYHHPYVNLYSGLGAGLCVNGGTELSYKGNRTEVGWAANFTIIGLSANYGRFFGGVEFGGMYAMQNKNMVFLLKSRMLNAFIGVRF